MPRYAHVSNESYESDANAGANELNRIRQESIQAENQHRIAAYERMHLELERAKQERQMAHDQAKTEQRIKYEYMMADAAKKLYAIDPSDPRATEKVGAVVSEFPQLLHNEPGLPSLKSDVQHYESLIQSGRRQDTGIDARSEAADLRNQHAIELKKITDQNAKDLVDHKEELRKARGPTDATKLQYQKAIEKTSNAQKQLDGTQGFIDEIEKKGENASSDEQARLTPLYKSRQKWQSELDTTAGIKTALESVHPELALPPAAPVAPATPVTEGDRPPAEPKAAGDEAPPVNPNLTPTPPVAPVAPAPPAGGISMAAGAADGMFAGLPSQAVAVVPAMAPVAPVVAAPDPHQMALDWATANPNDPRAAKIRALHGAQ